MKVPCPPGERAFSLVEVVVALAVVSFAIIGIIGFIPVGLQNLRSAIDMSTQTRIVESVTSSMNETGFTNVVAWSTNYYDDEGNTMTNATSPGVLYEAVINATAPTLIPGGLNSTNLMMVNVAISRINTPNLAVTNSELIANLQP
jgi:uncharacterized protein (TIGR02598 family)